MSAQNGTTLEGMVGGLPGVRQFGLNTNMAVDFSGAPSVALPGGTTIAGASNITSTSATALTVARAGTNYGLQVDESASNAVTGLKIDSTATGTNLLLSVISSGTNDGITIKSKGSGSVVVTQGTDSATAFQVQNAAGTNTAFNVDTSAVSDATGLSIASKAAGSGVNLVVTSSATNEALFIDSKGTSNININQNSGGPVQLFVSTVIWTASSSALVVGSNGTTNPVLQVDASASSQVAGVRLTGAATGGTVALATTDSGADANLSVAAKGAGTITFNPAVTATAGGAANDGIKFGSLGVGLFTGTGAPSFSAMNGSIYVDSAATSTTTRIYVNKSGAGTAGTTWTNLTTAA